MKGKTAKTFKACADCKAPAKCKAAGKCMGGAPAKGAGKKMPPWLKGKK